MDGTCYDLLIANTYLSHPKMTTMKRLFLFYLVVLFQLQSFATIRLPAVLRNNMVLQQKSTVKLWGWGSPGEKVSVTTTWHGLIDSTTVDGNGKWTVNLRTPVAGGPYGIIIKGSNTIELKNVLIGEVWICSGQSNMEFSYNWGAPAMKKDVAAANIPAIRFFQVQKVTALSPQEDLAGEWSVCDTNTVKWFSAVAFYFGKRLNDDLNVPIGLINASWGGTPAETWTPSEIVNKDPSLAEASRKLKTSAWWPISPGYTYNGMIAPLTNFTIAGAIWYQGESNTGTASTYSKLFGSMIESWRKVWAKELPFYFVQLAPYTYGDKNIAALLREAQVKTLALHQTGIVVTNDLADDTTDIHPKNKKDVGVRLAKLALANTYSLPISGAYSPLYNYMRVDGDMVTLYFKNVGTGLRADGRKAEGFFIAGADKQFYPAEARIAGSTITLVSKQVKQPVAVRYAFSNTAVGNIFSREGMPLSPFRTDDWEVDTSAVK